MNQKPDREFIEMLLRDAPEILVRKDAHIWSRGIFTRAYLESVRPKPKSFLIGGKVTYKKADFIAWLEARYGIEGDDNTIQDGSGTSQGAGGTSQGD